MAKRVKRSVAVAIHRDDEILLIRRSADDDELPGIWGLPAGTYTEGEQIHDLIERIGREKLGVRLTPGRVIASGAQERASYRLEMELWEAFIEGTPSHPEWRWARKEALRPGAESGSLCCELALREK